MRRLILNDPWGSIAWFADEPEHFIHFEDDPNPGLLCRRSGMPSAEEY